jgi:D-alanyl-D-alanine dipeptidase
MSEVESLRTQIDVMKKVSKAREEGFAKCRAERDALSNAVVMERDAIANKAREWAGHYSEGSDGRNTFVLFAEWVEQRGARADGD